MIGGVLALSAAPVGALVAEAAGQGGFDPYNLISAIPGGIFLILLIMGKLHADGDYRRLADELEAERAERVRLQTALTDRVIPALTRSTLVLETLSPILQTEVRLRAASRPDPDGG